MNPEILKAVGQIAGIGGLAVGTFLILFREVIRKSIFPNLSKQQAYNLLRLMVVLVWSVAIVGILAWTYANTRFAVDPPPSIKTSSPSPSVSVTPSLSESKINNWFINKQPVEKGEVIIKGYLIDKAGIDYIMTAKFPQPDGSISVLDPLEEAQKYSKEKLLNISAKGSGYGILFGTRSEGSWAKFDKEGNELARTLIVSSSKNSGIRVEATGRETKSGFIIKSIKETD